MHPRPSPSPNEKGQDTKKQRQSYASVSSNISKSPPLHDDERLKDYDLDELLIQRNRQLEEAGKWNIVDGKFVRLG